MTSRSAVADAFLASAGWGAARRVMLAGDASNRRYERIQALDGRTAVLMDAPSERGEDVRPFVAIAAYLRGCGLSAPKVLAEDVANGFLLLEDLGDGLFARVMSAEPALETPLYEAATDALAHLHGHAPPPGLAAYDPARMTQMSALAYQWYLGRLAPDRARSQPAFESAFHTLLRTHVPDETVLIQRDYHAENLLWLPDRPGIARVGLLDFQDAMLGHPAYDLVSLMQDARRDVPQAIESAMIARYIAATGQEPRDFDAAYHVLGVQRNLRILGVFARLCLRDAKPHYVDFIPRVWRYLLRDLSHPALEPVARLLRADFPDPGPRVLQSLRDECQTAPTP